ncbi:MAG: uL13 family ribosomal protein [archaeon]|jgi:large subunit ribosomal protein L13
MIVLNAKNKILGRLCTEVSSKLLRSDEKIIVVNANDAMISGSRENIMERFKERTHRKGKGNQLKNAKYPRYPDKMVKFAVRGMLPRNSRGQSALKNLKVFIDAPEAYIKDMPKEVEKPKLKGMGLNEICKLLGAKLKI